MKLPRRKFLQLAAGAAALPAVSRVAWAQTYPTRPIRLVIAFPPGGAFDFVGRPWAEKMKRHDCGREHRRRRKFTGCCRGRARIA